MKIVTPLSNVDGYQPLIEAGADEFFCGYVPYRWLKKYNISVPINRREYLLDNCNICSKTSLNILSRMVEKYGVPIKFAFNSLSYSPLLYPLLKEVFLELMELNFNTFIIADIGLVFYLRRQNLDCKIHLSGETGVFNRFNIAFLNELNIARFIFPGKTSMMNLKSCIRENAQPGSEFEAFVLNDWCAYLGAYCNTIHCDEMPHSCQLPYRIVKKDAASPKFETVDLNFRKMNEVKANTNFNNRNRFYFLSKKREKNYKLGESGCGLCRLAELKDIGVTHLKVVGRGNLRTALENDIKSLREAIQLMEKINDKNRFADIIKATYFQHQCPAFCFYPGE